MCPTPCALIGTSRRGRALLMLRNPEGIDSRKRPLDRRRAITGTVFGRSPRTPRLTTIRADAGVSGGVTMVTCRCHSRAAARHRSIDPANVFGAADNFRKLAVAADGFDLAERSSHTKRRSRILLSSGVRP